MLIDTKLLPKDTGTETVRGCIQTAEEDLRRSFLMSRLYLRSDICPHISSPLQSEANRVLYLMQVPFENKLQPVTSIFYSLNPMLRILASRGRLFSSQLNTISRN